MTRRDFVIAAVAAAMAKALMRKAGARGFGSEKPAAPAGQKGRTGGPIDGIFEPMVRAPDGGA